MLWAYFYALDHVVIPLLCHQFEMALFSSLQANELLFFEGICYGCHVRLFSIFIHDGNVQLIRYYTSKTIQKNFFFGSRFKK